MRLKKTPKSNLELELRKNHLIISAVFYEFFHRLVYDIGYLKSDSIILHSVEIIAMSLELVLSEETYHTQTRLKQLLPDLALNLVMINDKDAMYTGTRCRLPRRLHFHLDKFQVDARDQALEQLNYFFQKLNFYIEFYIFDLVWGDSRYQSGEDKNFLLADAFVQVHQLAMDNAKSLVFYA